MDRADESTWQYIWGGVAFLAAATCCLLASLGREWVRDGAGAIVLGVSAAVFMLALTVLAAVLAARSGNGNTTFSETLREGGKRSTVFPWLFAVFAGRWFHPADGLDLLGVAGVIILVALTLVVVIVGERWRTPGNETALPSWLVVLTGVAAGGLLWPMNP